MAEGMNGFGGVASRALATAAALLLLALPTIGDEAAAADGCWPAGSRTLAISSQARVFQMTRSERHAGRRYHKYDVVGCSPANGKWRTLFAPGMTDPDSDSPPEPSLLRVAGPFVAIHASDICDECGEGERSLLVRNLVSGQYVYRRVMTIDSNDYFSVSDLELGSDGVAAFIIDSQRIDENDDASGESGPVRRRVVTVGPRHKRKGEHTVDRGRKIRTHSLFRRGGTLYWKKGRAIRHAPFR